MKIDLLSDALNQFGREKWQVSTSFTTGVRRAYFDRLSALQQFKFVDPLVIDYFTEATFNNILLEKNKVVLAQV